MSKYNIHNDFKKYEKIKLPLVPAILPMIDKAMVRMYEREELLAGIKETKYPVAGYQGGEITLTVYEPEDTAGDLPGLVYFHGGAFALRGAAYHKTLLCQYALNTPCKVIFTDYRLVPKYPFPVGVEDCYQAFKWVNNRAAELGIDKEHIAVGG